MANVVRRVSPKKVPTDRPVQLSDLSPAGRTAAKGIVEDFAARMPQEMEKGAASKRSQAVTARAKGGKAATNAGAYDAAAARMEAAAPVVAATKRRRATVTGMAQNNVEAVEAAATTHRMPGESLAGTGWYHDANAEVAKAVPHGFPMDAAVAASSKLSQGTKPEDERASMGAAAHAIHHDVKLDVTPAMHAHWASRGLDAPAPVGGRVAYAGLSGAHAAALAAPEVREHMQRSNPHVAWQQIGRAASEGNRTDAHDILRGTIPAGEAQSPFTSPKTNRYTANIGTAVSGTQTERDRANEYKMRGSHVGDLVRGDVPKGQEMLDLYGQRHDTQTFNSPRYSTPQDSWQMGIHNVGLNAPTTIKAAGDLTPGSKTRQGVSAHPDARVGSAAVVHAVHDEATMKAAEMLTKKYRPGYDVPSALVQETGWTGVRRMEGTGTGGRNSADKVWNAHQRAQAEEAKVPKLGRKAFFDGGVQTATQKTLF